jgi:hypothetical protein
MIETDDFGHAVHPTPQTFRDRVAWALAAHDIGGGEGRMTDEEFDALDHVLRRIRALYASDKALGQFLGMSPAGARDMLLRLLQFAALERGLREKDGKHLMVAHLIAADWQSYLGSADAAIGVMLERPEAVAQMVSAAPDGGGEG